jgi:hypothetical protein
MCVYVCIKILLVLILSLLLFLFELTHTHGYLSVLEFVDPRDDFIILDCHEDERWDHIFRVAAVRAGDGACGGEGRG